VLLIRPLRATNLFRRTTTATSSTEHPSKEIAHVHVNASASASTSASTSAHAERKWKATRKATWKATWKATLLLLGSRSSFHLTGLIVHSPLSIITQNRIRPLHLLEQFRITPFIRMAYLCLLKISTTDLTPFRTTAHAKLRI
jgi:hypothetical protein